MGTEKTRKASSKSTPDKPDVIDANAKISFASKPLARGGKVACLLAGASLLLLILAVYLAFRAGGEGGALIGALGLISLILGIVGLVYGLLGFREEDKNYTIASIGSVACGLLVIFELLLTLTAR